MKNQFHFSDIWTDKAVLPHLALEFLLSQTRAWNRFPHESMHLPAARWWKLALRGEMGVYCCVEPARRSLIKLSPGSWNVISSFVIQARIICHHFACDGLLDNNGLGPDDAEAMLMVEGSQRSQQQLKKPLTCRTLKLEIYLGIFFLSICISSFFSGYIIIYCTVCGWCNGGNLLNHYFPLCTFLSLPFCSFYSLFYFIINILLIYYFNSLIAVVDLLLSVIA